MSEEEIIKELNEVLLHHRETEKVRLAIRRFLDLYNHEKETNHHLQNELDQANARIVELQNRIYEKDAPISTNEGLFKWVNVDNIVKKDKIKAKVTEIKNKLIEDEDMFITVSQAKLDTIIAIESILEEEGDENNANN